MANMSHCRFSNTLADLNDCYGHLEDGPDTLSDAEREARESLIKMCGQIYSDYGPDEE